MALEKQDYWVDMHPQAYINHEKIDTQFMVCLSYEARLMILNRLQSGAFPVQHTKAVTDQVDAFIDRLDSSVS